MAGNSRRIKTSGGKPPVKQQRAGDIEVDEDEKKVIEDYEALCRELNMDSATSDSAWDAYKAIKQNYTLEVPQLIQDHVPFSFKAVLPL